MIALSLFGGIVGFIVGICLGGFAYNLCNSMRAVYPREMSLS